MAQANRRSLNVEGAYRHVLTDLYGFAGTLIAGVVIVIWGFDRADAIASLVVVLLMLKAAVEFLRPALRILLEATPEDIDVEEVRQHLLELPEVQSVHDLHAWTLTSSLPVLTAHVVVDRRVLHGRSGGPRARPSAGVPVGPLRRRAFDPAVRVARAHGARARRARLGSRPRHDPRCAVRRRRHQATHELHVLGHREDVERAQPGDAPSRIEQHADVAPERRRIARDVHHRLQCGHECRPARP